jgi:chromosome segregation ATPase
MTKDKPSRREPFIARRDEPISPRTDLPEQKKKPRPVSSQSAAAPKKPGFIVLCFIVALLSICLVALSVFSWRQSQSQQYLLQRFDDLSGRLESSDESVAQSGAALAMKLSKQEETLAKHWSEIKKLWGVTNDRNKKAIKALQLADGEAKKGLKKTQQALASLQADLSSLRTGLKTTQAEVKKVSSASLVASAQTDDFHRQLTSLESQLKALDSEAVSLQKLIEKNRQSQSHRLAEFEQAVRSIDAFRKQTNEKFSRLHPGPVAP